MEPPDTGFFNGGQKAQFWEIVVGSVVFLITGIILWTGARTFGRWTVAVSYVLHDISAVIMLGGIFIHIYLSTIGEPGTFQAMIRGAVSEAWAWTFHPAWYKEVTGRDPVEACEEARRRGQIRQKVILAAHSWLAFLTRSDLCRQTNPNNGFFELDF